MFRKDDQIYEAQENGEFVLFNLRTGQFYGLNHIGSEFWKLLFTREMNEIYQYFEKTYKADPVIVRLDLEVLLNDLIRNGLVHRI